MKVQSNKLVDLARALSKSAEQSQADTRLVIAPDVAVVTELPGPFKSAHQQIVVNTIQSDTFYLQLNLSRNGAGATQSLFSQALLDAGVWRLYGTFSHNWNVAAATLLAGAAFGMQDPDGQLETWAYPIHTPVSGQLVSTFDRVYSLDRPGWLFWIQLDVSQATDLVYCRMDMHCNKVV